MGRLAPWTERAMEVLADGSWHELNSVVIEMVKVIPPGPAMRRAEHRRTSQRVTSPAPGQRAVPRSAEYLRLLGGRAIALEALKGSKRLDHKEDLNGRWVRIKPSIIAQERPVELRRVYPSF